MSTQHRVRRRIVAASVVAVAALSGTAMVACEPDAGAASAAASAVAGHNSGHDAMRGQRVNKKTQLYTTMRSLWDQHMEWTWSAVVAFASDSPALQPTIDRLLRNQSDLGAAVGSFYGKAAGEQATTLLKTHITDAVPVLQAAKAGDKAALDSALAEWQANAREIADLLSSANPRRWKKAEMREMMKTHIDQTAAYAAKVIGGDYAGAIALYDEAQAHMAQMADMLSAGIIAQFPKKF